MLLLLDRYLFTFESAALTSRTTPPINRSIAVAHSSCVLVVTVRSFLGCIFELPLCSLIQILHHQLEQRRAKLNYAKASNVSSSNDEYATSCLAAKFRL